MEPKDILAGPIIRRAEPGRVHVWLATRVDVEIRAEVVSLGRTGGRVGGGTGRSVALGPNLFVHLVEAVPDGGTFPLDELLGYDIEVPGPDGDRPRRLADLGLLSGTSTLAYGDLPLPTFFLRGPATPELHLLHGSCRLLHGKGEDSFPAADEVLAGSASDVATRPSAFFLTGDQIYGDDVAGPLIGHLTRLGAELLGPDDDTSVPDLPPLSSIPIYGRQSLVCDRAKFTSDKAGNHLLSLGEYVAAYVIAWNGDQWPARFPPAEEAVSENRARGRELTRLRRQYDDEVACLEVARRALPAVRRVLANVPVYTAVDDHDVTDDWNLTLEWRRNVERSPTGRRVVANALAAFWAFQGWGNAPRHFDDDFVSTVAAGPGTSAEQGGAYDQVLWSFHRWGYHAPTEPPTVVLDTRTLRSWASEQTPARLIDADHLAGVRALIEEARPTGSGPVILVSAVPVFGLEIQERRQRFLAGKVGPYRIDFEAWHSDLQGLVDFMRLLIDDLGLRGCVVLSGDVHYGLNVQASFSVDGEVLHVAQLVSSSFKHSGTLAKAALQLLGRAVSPEHERLGWDRAPTFEAPTGLARRWAGRPVNTDGEADAPVFLSPELARRAQPDEPPRYRETRCYVGPEERPSWVIVGEANVGLVTIAGDRVVHRLLARNGPETTTTYTATLSIAAPEDGPQ
ncbi:MAG: hypothetical protein H0V33_04780 [Acidimicrobiia bacterium]|nr:hypothetical protein [Acidimicrobiia bacterium]